MRVKVESKWQIALPNPNAESRDHFADHCFEVLDALGEMENLGLTGADLSLDFSDEIVCYEFYIDGETLDEVQSKATTAMRSAVHGAGGFTSTWENYPLQLRLTVVEDGEVAPTLVLA